MPFHRIQAHVLDLRVLLNCMRSWASLLENTFISMQFYSYSRTLAQKYNHPSCKVVYLLLIANKRCPYQPSKENLDIALILGEAVINWQVIDDFLGIVPRWHYCFYSNSKCIYYTWIPRGFVFIVGRHMRFPANAAFHKAESYLVLWEHLACLWATSFCNWDHFPSAFPHLLFVVCNFATQGLVAFLSE